MKIPTPLIWQKQISTDFSLPLTVYEALFATCFCFISYEKKKTFRMLQMHLKEEGLICVFCFIQQKQEMKFQNAWPGKPSSAQPY